MRQFIMGQAEEISLKAPKKVGDAGGKVIHDECHVHGQTFRPRTKRRDYDAFDGDRGEIFSPFVSECRLDRERTCGRVGASK